MQWAFTVVNLSKWQWAVPLIILEHEGRPHAKKNSLYKTTTEINYTNNLYISAISEKLTLQKYSLDYIWIYSQELRLLVAHNLSQMIMTWYERWAKSWIFVGNFTLLSLYFMFIKFIFISANVTFTVSVVWHLLGSTRKSLFSLSFSLDVLWVDINAEWGSSFKKYYKPTDRHLLHSVQQ